MKPLYRVLRNNNTGVFKLQEYLIMMGWVDLDSQGNPLDEISRKYQGPKLYDKMEDVELMIEILQGRVRPEWVVVKEIEGGNVNLRIKESPKEANTEKVTDNTKRFKCEECGDLTASLVLHLNTGKYICKKCGGFVDEDLTNEK